MKKLNLTFDMETLSLRPDAAIISIAAVPFMFDREDVCALGTAEEGVPAYESLFRSNPCNDKWDPFYETVDATTCAMAGMAFDMSTVEFWASQPDEIKAAILNERSVSIRNALEDFLIYLENMKSSHDVDEVVLWVQGSDFDIPVLKNALYKIMELTPENLPWKYNNIRDARTYLLETEIMLSGGKQVEPYSTMEVYEDLVKHHSLHDCIHTALNLIGQQRKIIFAMENKNNGKDEDSPE